MAKPILTTCIVAKSDICALTVGSYMQMGTNPELNNKVFIQQRLAIGQSDLPKARSEQASQWFVTAKPKDLFMFIDSDQTFSTQDIITSLSYIEKGYDVVCGGYARKTGIVTVEPKNVIAFHRNGFGELFYGSTGFMMMTYEIVKKVIESIGPQVRTSNTNSAWQLFFERVVDEPELKWENLWLGEDYSFCYLVRKVGGKIAGYISPTIGHIIPTERFVQRLPMSDWPEKSIAFFCGLTAEKWGPKSLDKGIGGSELAVIKLSKLWASKGYKVTVFCACDEPGEYDGVKYVSGDQFSFADKYDIVIIWRSLDIPNLVDIHARVRIIDLHDVVLPQQITPRVINNIDKFCVKSNYHASMLTDVPKEKINVICNGGSVTDLSPYKNIVKDPNYFIYTSSYDRGLAFMLKWGWPKIKKAFPNAYLKIFYGWNTFDAIKPKNDDTKLLKDTISSLMRQPGVSEHGRISQKELLAEKAKASIHYYVGDFAEIDCISVRESASLGAIPVVSSDPTGGNRPSVFSEKDYCICIEGNPRTKEMQEKAADKIIELMSDSKNLERIRADMARPMNESWENIADRWITLFQ